MITLAGGASTNSRATRPLPAGAVRGENIAEFGAQEVVQYTFDDGHTEKRGLLSWVVGQAGLLWGGGPWPKTIQMKIDKMEVPGSYGHKAEHELTEELGRVFEGYLSSNDMAVRFFSNGGDPCEIAVRISRSLADNATIATQGYHGMHTDFGHQPAWAGYPWQSVRQHLRFEFGDVVRGLAAGRKRSR